MTKPHIAVTGAYRGDEDEHVLPGGYTRALERAGAVPAIVPVGAAAAGLDRLIDTFDGWVLPGGGDLDPVYFGQEPQPGLGDISPERDALEWRLCRALLAADRPLFAICRGAQILNAAAGGAVIQDLGTTEQAIKHDQQAPGWYPTHAVEIADGSWLARWLDAHRGRLTLPAHEDLPSAAPKQGQRRIRVNSFHHQGIGEPAPGLRVTARSPDGLIEGLESADHRYAVGVQWHPERMIAHIPGFIGLFEQFVAAAREAVEGETT